MKKLLLSALSFFVFASHLPAAPAVDSESPEAKAKRLEWFKHDKYGMFIHWGLYSIPAGYWKGERAPGIGEWIMNRMRIPAVEYAQLAKQFNPIHFDADAYAQLAADAGMKYVVITSKHHDGFALFKSAVSKYNVVDATPFKRDIIKELADACAKRGLRFGVYYSQSQDWYEPGGTNNNWDFPSNEEKDQSGAYDNYLREKAEPQVRELLTNYGPICLVWFDTPQIMTGDRPKRLTDIVRTTQPDTLIDGRLGAVGDYQSTGDNVIPKNFTDDAFEVPATLNHTWGYRSDDHDWKRPGEIIFKLVDIVSKGGNYLLNIGPKADGTIPSPSGENLRVVGAWLKTYGEAIYGTTRTPFGEELGGYLEGRKDAKGNPVWGDLTEWRCTAKPGKLYFTLFRVERVGQEGYFALPKFKNKIKSAALLEEGGKRTALKVTEKNGIRSINPTRFINDGPGRVVVIEYEGDTLEK
ncbi:alpha-L-fucosidase [Oleiharenicola lentus]|uniref:alpha-L-fucosidase n=1 Tax=Oleiharenicola lentus TaxID=2508720 RepID=UPI003F66DCD7